MITPQTYDMFFELVKDKYNEDKRKSGSAVIRLSINLGESENVIKKFMAGTTHKQDCIMLSKFANYYGIDNNWIITNVSPRYEIESEDGVMDKEQTIDTYETDEVVITRHYSDIMTECEEFTTYYSTPLGKPVSKGTKNILLSEHFSVAAEINNVNTNIVKKGLDLPLMNNNLIMFGGPGRGKTTCVESNILQANSSMLINDVDDNLYKKCSEKLKKKGYIVKRLSVKDIAESNRYNPFRYIRSDSDIKNLVETLIQTTNPPDYISDPFWKMPEMALLNSLAAYLYHYAPEEKRNFVSMMELLRYGEKIDNEEFTKLDLLFKEAEEMDPEGFAIKEYKIFKMGAGKTLKSILISCAVRLQAFDIPDIAELTNTDDLDLELVFDNKMAIFMEMSYVDFTFNFIYSIFTTQFLDFAYYSKNNKLNKKDNHVIVFLDELQALLIPKLDFYTATCRHDNISFFLTLSSLSQMKMLYPNTYAAIMGCCDIKMFYGSCDMETVQFFAENIVKYQNISFKMQKKVIPEKINYLSRFNNDACLIITPKYILQDTKLNPYKNSNGQNQ